MKNSGFTLIELGVVVLVLTVGAAVISPALARSKPDMRTTQCRSNLRTLQMAQQMYASDNRGRLVPSAGGTSVDTNRWTAGFLNWQTGLPSGANTNGYFLRSTLLAAYYNADTRLFKCPADVVPSAIGTRIRSYSMNGFLGGNTMHILGFTAYRIYLKDTDFVATSPAQTWSLIDEHPDSINDGFFEVNMPSQSSWPAATTWRDVPASHHGNAASLSFFDGHVVTHKWTDPETLSPVQKLFTSQSTGKTSPNDSLWLVQRSSAPL